MNAQAKKRISLRDQFEKETGLKFYDYFSVYADWLENKLSSGIEAIRDQAMIYENGKYITYGFGNQTAEEMEILQAQHDALLEAIAIIEKS